MTTRAFSPSASLAAAAATLSIQASSQMALDPAVSEATAASTNAARYISLSAPVGMGTNAAGEPAPLPVNADSLANAASADARRVLEQQRAHAASAAVDTWSSAMARCSTFNEIVGLVSEPYRDTLRPLFSKYHAQASKLEQSIDELARWSEFSTENLDIHWPECIPKPPLPSLQVKKEVANIATELQAQLKAARRTYVQACLRTVCSARDAEVKNLQQSLDAASIAREIGAALVARFKVLSQRLYEGLDLQEWFEGLSANAVTGQGFAAERILMDSSPQAAAAHWANHPGRRAGLHAACLVYDECNAIALPTGLAVIQLVQVQSARARDARRRKADLKAASRADVAMDVDQPGGSREVLSNQQRAAIGDMLARQVGKQMAKLGGRHAQTPGPKVKAPRAATQHQKARQKLQQEVKKAKASRPGGSKQSGAQKPARTPKKGTGRTTAGNSGRPQGKGKGKPNARNKRK